MVMPTLEEAKRRYPVGTRFVGYYIGKIRKPDIVKEKDEIVYYHSDDAIGVFGHDGFIYEKGKWAKITYKPNQIIEIW